MHEIHLISEGPTPSTSCFQVPERAADRIDPDALQMTSAAPDSEDPQEV